MISITSELAAHASSIEALYDTCFGADRYHKASYALRIGVSPRQDLARIAIDRDDFSQDPEGRVIGAVRFWPVNVLCLVSGAISEALLLGPFAIDPDYQGLKLSKLLMKEALGAAESAGDKLVLLVGDHAYYQQFGFTSVKPKTISLPGARDADRLLYRQFSGLVTLPSVGSVERKPGKIAKVTGQNTGARERQVA